MSEAAPSDEDLAWAVKAYASGRPMDFVASVLGLPPRAAFKLIRAHKLKPKAPKAAPERQIAEQAFHAVTAPKPGAYVPRISKLAQFRMMDEEGEFIDKPQTPSEAAARQTEIKSSMRRKRALRRRFSKHWGMIWFLRRHGMSGRVLRCIYGAECLIWSVGGGIDVEIPQ